MLTEVFDLLQDLLGDPLLADLPENVDADDVRLRIARARGHVIDLTLVRAGNDKIRVSVLHNAKVMDLQHVVTKVIQRKTDNLPSNYSWKSFWKRYNLSAGSVRLRDPHKLLVHYGIKNNGLIKFTKRLRDKLKKNPSRLHSSNTVLQSGV